MKSVVNIAGKGRGVITTEHIKKGSLVELSDVIGIRFADIEHTILADYVYEFGEDHCLCLGLGSLFSHSRYPNLWLREFVEERKVGFYARYNIESGTELTIDYGYEPEGYDGT